MGSSLVARRGEAGAVSVTGTAFFLNRTENQVEIYVKGKPERIFLSGARTWLDYGKR